MRYPAYAQSQSVSPTQLIAHHQPNTPPQPLTLTPAQLLQQQQIPPQHPPVRAPFLRYQPHDRAHFPRTHTDRPPGTPSHDPLDRPASAASARSLHDPPIMPPPNSRPGTASGPRMNLAQQHQPIQMAVGIPMNRPPTRTGSALGHGSPKHSPRIPMGPLQPGMPMGPAMPPNMAMAQAMSPMQGIPPMAMGPSNMIPGGPLMGPPMQRPDMQPHIREPSAPVSRETVSLPAPLAHQAHGLPQSIPPSTGPFITLDNARQSSQPPPQQSRPAPPPHHSPMRKMGEAPAPPATPPVNTPPIPGTTPGQKLPPHIASLNPAVTKISYLPYVPSNESEDADQDKKPSPDDPTTDTDKDGEPPLNTEDPLPALTPSEVASLKAVMVRDSAYDTVYRARQARMLHELRSAGPGGRLAWWDRDFAANSGINRRPDRFDVRYPRPPRTDGSMALRKKGARREGIRMSVLFLFFYTVTVDPR